MRKTTFNFSKVLVLALALPISLYAGDFSYQQTTQITGGSILSMMKMAGAFSSQARKAGDPIVTTIYLKDNRMATVSTDSVEIIDLDKETITHIDTARRSYTVMTFQQMKDQMAKAQQEMEKRRPAAAPSSNANDVKMSFDVKVRNTGTVKQVSGLSTKEAILTMTMIATDQKTQQSGNMAITNDMWMVPEIPGYEKINAFHMRMAEKMGMMDAAGGMDMTRILAQNPGATDALAAMGKEMQKLKGTPVSQVMRMGTTTDGKPLPAASEAPLPADATPAPPSAGEIAKQSALSSLGGLGRFGGFGRKKDNDQPPPDQNGKKSGDAPPPTSAVLMESQTTSSNFSEAPVDPIHFEVPAGYKLVQTKM
jgi:hypothetical protein